jgi:hypothetical protein
MSLFRFLGLGKGPSKDAENEKFCREMHDVGKPYRNQAMVLIERCQYYSALIQNSAQYIELYK